MAGRKSADFSFSGLKTAVRQVVKDHGPLGEAARADLAAAFQSAVVDVLADRSYIAMQKFQTEFGKINSNWNFVVAGGVAANKAIRESLSRLSQRHGFRLVVPPAALCTDNGAMVAWAGLERLALGSVDSLAAAPLARWPLEYLDKFL